MDFAAEEEHQKLSRPRSMIGRDEYEEGLLPEAERALGFQNRLLCRLENYLQGRSSVGFPWRPTF